MKSMLSRALILVCVLTGAHIFAGPVSVGDSPICFFTNVASRLLSSELNLKLSRLQLYPTNQYTPAVQRLLQVTANIYAAANSNLFPAVFRPLFSTDATGTNIFITSYAQVKSVSGVNDAQLSAPFLYPVSTLSQAPYTNLAINIYGVPWIIGAKKSLPNFNELYELSALQVMRRLQVWRGFLTSLPQYFHTNEMFVMGITNHLGLSFWNSYSNDYVPASGAITVFARDIVHMVLTNESGFWSGYTNFTFTTNLSVWPGSKWGPSRSLPEVQVPEAASFIPCQFDYTFLPMSIYQMSSTNFILPGVAAWETNFSCVPDFSQFRLATTNWLQALILDGTNVIDYVQLAGPGDTRNIYDELADLNYNGGPTPYMWSTNANPLWGVTNPPTWGVANQIYVSRLGPVSGTIANSWTIPPNFPSGLVPSPASLAAFFDGFFEPQFQYQYGGQVYYNTNLAVIAPYIPIRTMWGFTEYQANDPLVHYTTTDLNTDLPGTTGLRRSDDLLSQPFPLRALNQVARHYQPWGRNAAMSLFTSADTDAYNVRLRDPLIWWPQAWSFPTGQDFSLNSLGRIHRGTPWQTLYLKSGDILAETTNTGSGNINIGTNTWMRWTGITDLDEATAIRPVTDRQLVSLLMDMLNTNDLLARLSINSPDLKAWAGLMDGFTAFSNSLNTVYSVIPPQFTQYLVASNSLQATVMADAIQATRGNGFFHQVGDVLAVPGLSDKSPYLSVADSSQLKYGITDEAYEVVPSQLLPLLRADSFGTVTVSNELLQVRFSGYDDHTYRIQVSPDLVHWADMDTNYPIDGVLDYSVPATNSSVTQFYRSVLWQ